MLGIFRRKNFYRDGLRFECRGCGRCCLARGKDGFVFLTAGDRKRIADHLGMTTLDFTRSYTRTTYGSLHLNDPEKDCQFLEEGRCSIYEVRPVQCRTWPFWQENLKRRAWERQVASFCAGAGSGRLYSAEEIEAIMRKGKDLFG